MSEDNSVKALEFLERLYPSGPWCLTAIEPNKKGIDTKTFGPETRAECLAWIRLHNGTRNLYWHVNPVLKPINKKAEREDIKMVCLLHVDVDPGAGQDLKEEQDKILQMFTTKLPRGVPEPSIVIFSGGGFQAFWRLEQPLEVNGDLARAEDAKLYNKQLEILFGGDNCHNIDRLMRLPFSMNIPDAKKAKKGRTPALARLVWFKDSAYPLSSFQQAPALQTAKGGLGAAPNASKIEVKISGNVRRVADVAELDEWNVPDRLKVIMNQGHHPDQEEIAKKKDTSRSSWLFDFVCNMLRCNVPDEVVFSIITDPEWGISASVLELKGNAERYAIKQIVSAKEFIIEPELRELNERYTVVRSFGGKCLVVWEEEGEGALKRTHLKKQPFAEFEKGYMNQRVQVGTDAQGNPKYVKKGKWWLEHPHRAQVERVVFAPDRADIPNTLNLWKGYSVEAKPGDKHLSYLAHVRNIICSGNDDHFDYLVKWMARVVQQPASPGQVAIVLQGGRGAGKGFFTSGFGGLFGRHFLQVSSASHLVGNFNAHLRDALVVFSDEAFYAGDKKHNSTLKTLITEDILPIESKGVDVEFGQNYVHLIMASNEDHVVRTGIDERRFFILRVSEDKKQDTAYFEAMAKDLDSGGRENLLHYLMNVDLSGYQVRTVPKTKALDEQTDQSLDPRDEWLFRVLQRGHWLRDDQEWKEFVPRRQLYEEFVHDVTFGSRITLPGTETSFGLWIKRRLPGLSSAQPTLTIEIPDHGGFVREVKRRLHCYCMPELSVCRKAWETLRGRPENWDAI